MGWAPARRATAATASTMGRGELSEPGSGSTSRTRSPDAHNEALSPEKGDCHASVFESALLMTSPSAASGTRTRRTSRFGGHDGDRRTGLRGPDLDPLWAPA